VKTSTLLASIVLVFVVSPAFGNTINLFVPSQVTQRSGDSSSNWGYLQNCSCFGGEWDVNAVNGKYYGNFISAGEFQLFGSEGNGYYASGNFTAFYIQGPGDTVQGTLSNIYLNPTTDVLRASITGQISNPYGYLSGFSGTFVANLNPNGTLGNIHIATGNGPNASFVPEPGTLAMVGTGLLGMFGAVRRRLQKG